jgi:putative SOS response-associated peptidase YedK
MCNLYSVRTNQAAILARAQAMRDIVGNLPPLPGVYPDYAAPIVRTAADGARELAMVRWGMPSPALALNQHSQRTTQWGPITTTVNHLC